MRIEMKLYLGIIELDDHGYYSTPNHAPSTEVLCDKVLGEYFGELTQLITLVLDTEEHKQAYRVKFNRGWLYELTVFDDGPGSAIIGRHATYHGLDELLERFPRCTAWLSIELGHD